MIIYFFYTIFMYNRLSANVICDTVCLWYFAYGEYYSWVIFRILFIFIRYKRERKKRRRVSVHFVRAFLYALHLMYINNIIHDLWNNDSYFSIFYFFSSTLFKNAYSIIILLKIDESNFQTEKFGWKMNYRSWTFWIFLVF